MKNKLLIIGFGSIGKRHAKIFSKHNLDIFILTNQNIKQFKKINKLSEIKHINPDYFFICSPTSSHYQELKYIEKNFKKKIILVEKPLFHRFHPLIIKNNKVIVGYNLRHHPILQFIKKKIKSKKVISIYVRCLSNLKNWRQNNNLKNSYSKDRKRGGGVLLDLSHELDYMQWVFGKITKINFAQVKKITNITNDSEDYVNIQGNIGKINFVLNLNYFSKIEKRDILIDGHDFNIYGDLINNKLTFLNKKNEISKKINIKKNNTYEIQANYFLKKMFKNFCSYKNGNNINKLIDRLKKI